MKTIYQNITFNVKTATVRNDRMEGRDYYVAPMVMMTEGVHNGTRGPLFYPANELARAVPAWNHKPILVYHPLTNAGTAADPKVIDNQKVGIVMNSRWDGKQRAEAWLEKTRIPVVDNRVQEFLDNKNSIMEVSTGLCLDLEEVVGDWNEEVYEGIARNHAPDHLALLPDQKGACSVEDGAGLLALNHALRSGNKSALLEAIRRLPEMIRNQMSHSNLWSSLSSLLREKMDSEKGWYGWLEDVYDDFIVYSSDKGLFKLGYTAKDTTITLSDESPLEVRRVTEYRALDGSFVGNSAGVPDPKEISDMTKKEKVDALILNKRTKFEEKNREQLMLLNEDTLDALVPDEPAPTPITENKTPAKDIADAAKEGAKELTPPAPVVNAQAPKPVTFQDLVNNADEETKEMLGEMGQSYQAEKQRLISTITANSSNVFTAEQLGKKKLAELRGIAALASPKAPAPTPSYGGAFSFDPPVVNANQKGDEEILGLPTMNFEPEAAAK